MTELWFQHEFKVDPSTRKYEVVARGYPGSDGKLVTLVRRGPPDDPDAPMSEIIELEP